MVKPENEGFNIYFIYNEHNNNESLVLQETNLQATFIFQVKQINRITNIIEN